MEDILDDFFDQDSLRLLDRFNEEFERGEIGFYDADEYVMLGSDLITLGEFEKAEFLLDRAMEQCPTSVEIKLKRAELSLEMDRFDDCLRRLAEIEEIEPYIHEIFLIKGHAFRALQRYPEARDAFERARSLGADPLEVNLGMAQVASVWPEIELWPYLKGTLGTDADTTDTCNRFIQLAVEGGLQLEGIEHVRKVLKDFPYSVMYWKTLAELSDAAGLYEQAIEADDFVLAIHPKDKESMWHKLVMIDKLNPKENNLDYFKMMESEFADEPDYLKDIWVKIARELERSGQWEEALDYYRKMLDVTEMRQYAFFRMGVVALFRTDFRQALLLFDYAMEEDSVENQNRNMAKLLYAKSRTCYYMGDSEQVMAYDMHAVETDPENPYLFISLAVNAVYGKQIPQALNYLRTKAEFSENPGFHVALGILLLQIGQRDEALVYLALGFQKIPVPSLDSEPRLFRMFRADQELTDFLNSFAKTEEDDNRYYDDYLYFGPELSFGFSPILRFGLLGYPLGHSFSASYFNSKFQRECLDAEYTNFEYADLEDAVSKLRNLPGLCGFNVTVPYKKAVVSFLKTMDEQAAAIGAVNVVRVNEDGSWSGFNTDCVGFRVSLAPVLQEHGYSPETGQIHALVLGNGGASQAVQYALSQMGIPYYLVCRDPSGFRPAVSFQPKAVMDYAHLDSQIAEDCLLWINTTSLGMYPKVDICPDVPYELLSARHILYDVVYNPRETLFLKKGRERGAVTVDGLSMLYAQAEAAWKIWSGRDPVSWGQDQDLLF